MPPLTWYGIIEERSRFGLLPPILKAAGQSGDSFLTDCPDDSVNVCREVYKYLNHSDSTLLRSAAEEWLSGIQIVVDCDNPHDKLQMYRRDDLIERSELLKICIYQLRTCLADNTLMPINFPLTETYVPLGYLLPAHEAKIAAGVAIQTAELLRARSTRFLQPVTLTPTAETFRSMFWVTRDKSHRPVLLWRVRDQPENKTQLHSLLSFLFDYARLLLFVRGTAETCILIVDCRGFNLHKLSLAKFRSVQKLISRQFPMISSKSIIIPNSQTSVAWELVKHFLTEREQQTIEICPKQSLASVLADLGIDAEVPNMEFTWPFPIHRNEVPLPPLQHLEVPKEPEPEPIAPVLQVTYRKASSSDALLDPRRLIVNPFASADSPEEDFISRSPRAGSSSSSSAYGGEVGPRAPSIGAALVEPESDSDAGNMIGLESRTARRSLFGTSEEEEDDAIALAVEQDLDSPSRRVMFIPPADPSEDSSTGYGVAPSTARTALILSDGELLEEEERPQVSAEAYLARPLLLPAVSPTQSSSPPRSPKRGSPHLRMSRAVSPRVARILERGVGEARRQKSPLVVRPDLQLETPGALVFAEARLPPRTRLCCGFVRDDSDLVR